MHSTRDIIGRRRLYLVILLAAVITALLPHRHQTPAEALQQLQATVQTIAARIADHIGKGDPQ